MKVLFQFLIFIIISVSSVAQKPLMQQSTDSIISSYLGQVNTDSIRSYILDLQNFGTREATIDSTRKKVAKWIQDKFISFGYTNVVLDSFIYVFWGYDTTWQYNVICHSTGTIRPDKVLIMGAHHDSRSDSQYNPAPGADDNASGVAGVLETARIMKKNNYQNPLTIEFITFAAEEIGMVGSRNYATKAVSLGTDIKMMINFDMIAYSATDTISSVWYINEGIYQNGLWLAGLADSIRKNYTILSPYYQTGTSATDSGPFNYYGFSSILLEEYYGPYSSPVGHNPYFHTVNDILINCNLEYCTQIIKVGFGMLLKAPDTLTNVQEYSSFNTNPILLFPNPANDEITIVISDFENSNLEIRNINGQLLQCLLLRNSSTNININNLPSGIYLLKIINDRGIAIKKIVKQ